MSVSTFDALSNGSRPYAGSVADRVYIGERLREKA